MQEIALTAAACFSVFFLPGLLFLCALDRPPYRDSRASRWLLGHLASVWLVLIPGLVLSRLRLLDRASVVLVLGVEISLLGAIALSRWRRRPPQAPDQQPSKFALPALLFVVAVVASFHLRDVELRGAVPGGAFYLSEVKSIVDAGGFPNRVTHFGNAVEPQVDDLHLVTVRLEVEAKSVRQVGFVFDDEDTRHGMTILHPQVKALGRRRGA